MATKKNTKVVSNVRGAFNTTDNHDKINKNGWNGIVNPMNEICTNVEQCKKFIELGIGFDTADLTVWELPVEPSGTYKFISSKIPTDTFPSITDGYCEKIPAWSLTTLLNMIPNYKIIKMDGENLLYSDYHVEPIDKGLVNAAFNMICYLKENNKI